MIRNSARLAAAVAMALVFSSIQPAHAQDQAPSAPGSDQAQAPAAPTGPPKFPAPDPADFTADSPSKEVVNAFMQANLGFDANAMWQVQAIQKTQIPGMNKVVIFIGDKAGKQQPYRLAFFTTPDQKHIIVGEKIIPFGEHPFADYRALLQQRADGPFRGSPSKDFELVEFADFQCPHCKEAQANMEKLVTDFPKARIVFQNDPLASIHPQSVAAASYGHCVAKQAGSTAFFQFASAVFEAQDGLSTTDGATLTLNSAATKAGLDPKKIAACAASPETKAAVDSSVQLSKELDIASVPTLVINGRQVPANTPYETLKQIVEFQARMDNVTP